MGIPNRMGMRALLIAGVVAIAGLTAPAGAGVAKTPPALGRTSVDSGWSTSSTAIAAIYDKALTQQSRIEVRDAEGELVPGTVTIDGSAARTLTWTAVGPAEGDPAPLMTKYAPYTATFTAWGVTQDLAAYPAPVVSTATFDVDTYAPVTPVPMTTPPAQPVEGGLVVITDGGTLQILGSARDVGANLATAMSGVAKVELHFYNVTATANPLDPTRAGSEVVSLRRTIDATDCCEQGLDYLWDVSSLPSKGYWNVKVSAIDAAGSRSKESEPIKVLWLGA